MTEQRLPGGRSFGAVRVGDEVRRPPQPWTATVHTVLRHPEHARSDDAVTAGIASPAGFDDPGDRRRRSHLLLDAYGYTGDRSGVRDAIAGRVERNVAVIRELAATGEPTFQRRPLWAADLVRSGAEVAALPDEFWQPP
jgi:hypothetical protein